MNELPSDYDYSSKSSASEEGNPEKETDFDEPYVSVPNDPYSARVTAHDAISRVNQYIQCIPTDR